MPHSTLTIEELAVRDDAGVKVSLLWTRETDRVCVSVDDIPRGVQFELEVLDGESPIDVFKHPYAYAAWGRMTGIVSPTPTA